VRALRDAGFAAYFAGGCVRDELLGRVPSDYDVATDAAPAAVTRIFPRTAEVGAHFGVVLVKIGSDGSPRAHDADVVEVATFRSDGIYADHRRPQSVRFSSPEEDARRRDFTVNALFLDPLSPDPLGDGPGRVIDFVGGLADLDARVLRAVGDADQRLNEDHLRALRAARLSAKLGFAIEDATARAIRAHASSLKGISRERIGEELRAILGHPARARGATLLHDLDLERPVLGAIDTPLSLGGRAPTTLAGLGPDESNFGVLLAAWALDLGLAQDEASWRAFADGSRAALALSNDERSDLLLAGTGLGTLRTAFGGMGLAAQKRFVAGRGCALARRLLRVVDPAAESNLGALAQTFSDDGVGIAPPALVTGDMLIAWGAKPGPRFRGLIDRLYDAQLEGRVKNLAEARELARELGV
jgi:tRNA nucleotidyltransferase/poly(A) polymerase